MKVLVTGAGGFIGKEVVAALKKRKHTVVVYDNADGKDVRDGPALVKALRGVHAVIHLAAIIDNKRRSLRDVNIDGTHTVAGCARMARVKKLVFLSSTGVYGTPRGMVSEHSPLAPQTEYEWSKEAGERIVLSAHNELQVCIVRSAMVFGANEYWRGLLGLLKKKYPLPCSGDNTFQIMYAKELARALMLVLAKGKNGEIYLAAGDEKPTLNEFIALCQKEMGLEQKISHIPSWVAVLAGTLTGNKLLTAENIRHLSKEKNYDTGKLKKLGWKQKTSLAQATAEVVRALA